MRVQVPNVLSNRCVQFFPDVVGIGLDALSFSLESSLLQFSLTASILYACHNTSAAISTQFPVGRAQLAVENFDMFIMGVMTLQRPQVLSLRLTQQVLRSRIAHRDVDIP